MSHQWNLRIYIIGSLISWFTPQRSFTFFLKANGAAISQPHSISPADAMLTHLLISTCKRRGPIFWPYLSRGPQLANVKRQPELDERRKRQRTFDGLSAEVVSKIHEIIMTSFISCQIAWLDLTFYHELCRIDRRGVCYLKKITLFLTFNWVLDWKSLTKAEEAGIWKPQLPDWNQKNQIVQLPSDGSRQKKKNTKRKTYKESWSDRVKNKSNFLVFSINELLRSSQTNKYEECVVA